jgi:hypothetical protein
MFNLQNTESTDCPYLKSFLFCCSVFCLIFIGASATLAQTATFTYQGRFTSELKQQNVQISAQAEQINIQQKNLEALKQVVCTMNPAAKICGNQ